MAEIYRPLAPNEFRVLQLHPSDNDADTIHCSLQHVPLPILSSPEPDASPTTLHKGHDRLWPELQHARHTNDIFGFYLRQTSQTPSTPEPATTPSPWHAEADLSLPWRFSWGDYIALSYVWGPTEPQQGMLLNDQPFSIGPALHDALLKLRKSERIKQGFRLWVDAICINQADLIERAAQVCAMRQIYSSAWHVAMSLGAAANDSDRGVAAIRWMAAQQRAGADALDLFTNKPRGTALGVSIDWSPEVLRSATFAAVSKLLTRPYFRRMWILQEIAMAREDCPVLCGDVCLSWGELCAAADFIGATQGKFEARVTGRSSGEVYVDSMQMRIEDGAWSSERTWKLLQRQMVLQKAEKEDGAGGSDVLLPLRLARLANVTNAKDRVYGILGIKAIAERVQLVPNYSLGLATIYRQFMTELLAGGDLTALRLLERPAGTIYETSSDGLGWAINGQLVMAGLKDSVKSRLGMRKEHTIGDQCPHDVPSWVVCWACRGPLVSHLRGLYHAATAPHLKDYPKPTFTPDGLGVQLHGVVVDDIMSLSSFHHAEKDDKYPFVSEYATGIKSSYGDIEATREALWRTLVGNTTPQGGCDTPDDLSWLISEDTWLEASSDLIGLRLSLAKFLARNKSLALGEHTFGDLIRPVSKEERLKMLGPNPRLTPQRREEVLWMASALAWRRLAGTQKGRIGLVPAAAKVGDCVVVLGGCDVPVVMRRQQFETWSVVGECYVHGVMKGEALEAEERLWAFDVI